MSIGSRIREARKQKKLTQSQLAQQCGITKSAISNYENDVSTPDVDKLSTIMDCLEVDPNYIYQDYFLATAAPSLTSDELAVILAYRRASADDKKAIHFILKKYETQSAASPRIAQTG